MLRDFIMIRSSPSLARTSRRAFTLVELLVVISIIAVLIGLLIPAVNAARESGRRTKCTNNQYQMAMAAIRHNDSNGYVPGWRNAMPTNSVPQPASWPIVMLPFVEKNDAYKAIAMNPLTASTPFIDLYVCPSASLEATSGPALTYSGNCGSASNARRADGVMLDTTITSGIASGRLGMDDVSNGDGTAKTLLFSEESSRAATLAEWNVMIPITTDSPSGEFDFQNSSPLPPCFGIWRTPNARVINDDTPGAPGASSQPSSQHPGGVVVAFCDGHTGFLQDGISAAVYAQVLSWNHLKSSAMSQTNWQASTKFPLSDSDLQ
jgi:prepilin-type N-terminal cleavage/methylation domain-containing protein/prepilin-type processing-associated H-X9-DG protein